ncbi:cystathionine beta-lyase [Variovorax arabinosiphilus]|uniref:cystathionine beta-lyase n=1 Tax=Variovorax arabinosiphilus TaxID=3053498 RepID=UPI0025791176|nr:MULTISPECIES: cystathionine beta-lyase [unclassified Variovorax]MDM0119037.1 cystathionine beta-lyase [Variovorax sp. J2L1-78]MDM0129463.1 cystathionine beta-lyase [Variovorax sp. J2L1-63]MDM0232751.1 cystathionine beta-lyase [Variovorax sp. J2R1-6]
MSEDKRAKKLGAGTRLLHAGAPALRDGSGPVNVPVVRTSTVRFENTAAHADYHHRRTAGERVASYGRHGLDTHRALEDAVTGLEGGHRAFLTPSGLSAITLVLLALLSPGDHALVADGVYAPLRRVDSTLLQRLGITVEYFSPAHDDLANLIRPNTRLLYLESPSSLLFEVLDLPALTAVARDRGVTVATDNTWSGGWFYQPLALGANISIQAATKYIAGHSDLMQGIVVVDSPVLAAKLSTAYEALGLTIGADDAYLALRGLRTLPVRLAQHQRHATEVAGFLQQQPQVARVFYPARPSDPGHALWKRDFSGASGLVSFAFRHATPAAADAFVDALALFGIGASWGGYESLALVAQPERLREHRQWTGDAPVVRLHIGLEDPADLIADLSQAFAAAAATAQR